MPHLLPSMILKGWNAKLCRSLRLFLHSNWEYAYHYHFTIYSTTYSLQNFHIFPDPHPLHVCYTTSISSIPQACHMVSLLKFSLSHIFIFGFHLVSISILKKINIPGSSWGLLLNPILLALWMECFAHPGRAGTWPKYKLSTCMRAFSEVKKNHLTNDFPNTFNSWLRIWNRFYGKVPIR